MCVYMCMHVYICAVAGVPCICGLAGVLGLCIGSPGCMPVIIMHELTGPSYSYRARARTLRMHGWTTIHCNTQLIRHIYMHSDIIIYADMHRVQTLPVGQLYAQTLRDTRVCTSTCFWRKTDNT